jgi:ribonuclease Z
LKEKNACNFSFQLEDLVIITFIMSVQLWKLIKRREFNLPGTPWSIVGYSKCARNTLLYIPQLNIAFDAGLATDVYPSHIFVTHAHMDHIGELFRYVIDPPNGLKPTVFLPRPSKEFVDEYIQSSAHLPSKEMVKAFEGGTMNAQRFVEASIHMTKNNEKIKVQWNPVYVSIPKNAVEGEPVILRKETIKNFKFEIEIIKSSHTIATTGYGITECRTRLHPDYEHLKGNQEAINELKSRKIDVNQEVKFHHVCYLGDTDHRVLANPQLEKYRTIIMECTFLHDEDAKHAKEKKHILLSKLLPYIQAHPHITFMLCHFSTKYKDRDVVQFFKELDQHNIVPIIHDFDELESEATADLITGGNQYATNTVLDALRAQGYTITPPIIVTTPQKLCEECAVTTQENCCNQVSEEDVTEEDVTEDVIEDVIEEGLKKIGLEKV